MILGIDPSKDTGLAIVEGQHVHAATCLHLTAKDRQSMGEREQCYWITQAALDWSQREAFASVCMEIPNANALTTFKTRGGGKAIRSLSSSFQWRLIGWLEAAFSMQGHRISQVSPAEVKAAVGQGSKAEKDAMIGACRAITTWTGDGLFNYAAGAQADAIAVALAGAAKDQNREGVA